MQAHMGRTWGAVTRQPARLEQAKKKKKKEDKPAFTAVNSNKSKMHQPPTTH